MKIWINNEEAKSHRLVRLNAEAHSGYRFLGDLDDEALHALFLDIDPKSDAPKNIEMLKYYGYLHLFVIASKGA